MNPMHTPYTSQPHSVHKVFQATSMHRQLTGRTYTIYTNKKYLALIHLTVYKPGKDGANINYLDKNSQNKHRNKQNIHIFFWYTKFIEL